MEGLAWKVNEEALKQDTRKFLALPRTEQAQLHRLICALSGETQPDLDLYVEDLRGTL